ncbi:MAG: hypothetical protein IPG10_14745 [Flavobacteriales bacterium]|jgi:hypothetical protein|nr:hypothetical protein [Flavobacteriales bacterium]MBK7084879.1 hypothetical protein [Flavobacteriales bacterium]MBK7270559.1 hypothetical protein [Flavobacteriales bacterium]MBK7751566.1 hypothetical protein [Flavobacteriales bacterium]MBK9073904.1 hypothetical protein [Flavobacteriales bacterium]
MDSGLMVQGDGEVRRYLDRAEILRDTVEQLRKDLALSPDEFASPEVGDAAFEQLRAGVLGHLEAWQVRLPAAFARAVNRVDLTERMVDEAMARGGLSELAGVMVQRCLLKVLLRKRFAGKG